MSRIPLPGLAEAREIDAPVMIEVITGNRWLQSLEAPDDGSPQVNGWRERALFTIHEATGLFQAETQYGNYSYTWPPAHRSSNLFDFLASLDFGYFMGKAFAGDYRELDVDATLKELRQIVIQKRKDGDLDKFNAREAWDRLATIEANPPRDENDFARMWDDEMLNGLMSVFDIPFLTRDKFPARHFWEVIWPVLINSEPFTARRAKKEQAA